MQDLPEDMGVEVAELPGRAQEFWWQAFWRAWPEVGGDVQRAAAEAWQNFARMAKGGGRRGRGGRVGRREEARKEFCRRARQALEFLEKDEGEEREAGWGVGVGSQREPVASSMGEAGQVLDRFAGEMVERVFEEAVVRGWLKPEQRLWAEIWAKRDWQGLMAFLSLAAASGLGAMERGSGQGAAG